MGVEKRRQSPGRATKNPTKFFGEWEEKINLAVFFFFYLAPQQALFECLCLGEGQKLNDFGQLIFWDQVFWWL